MQKRAIPYKRVLFICTHKRENEPACANVERGENSGLLLAEELKNELKARGLNGKLRVVKSGCLDFCSAGPALMVVDNAGDYTLCAGLEKNKLPEIIEEYLQV